MTSPDEQPAPHEPRADEPRPDEPRPDEPRPDEPRPDEPRPDEPRARRLTRSSSDRVVGGVAGGLGRHLGIDPILVRIAFVLLCFAGGAGFLAYLALLAFVPSDDGQPLAQGRTRTAVAALGLVVAAVIFLGPPVVVLGPGLLLLGLLAVVVVLVYRAIGRDGDPARAAARAGLALLAVLAACGAALGVAFVAALGGGTVIAILTVVTGLTLVATAFLGGARWLIVPALVLALPLAVVAAGNIDIEGGIGQREYRPAALGQLQPHYRLGMGSLDLDLRDVQLPAGRTEVALDLGVGGARIQVADDVCVTSDVQVGAGAADVFDHVNDGVDVAFAEGGTPAAGRPELHVKAKIGAGRLEIDRDGQAGPFGGDGGQVACP